MSSPSSKRRRLLIENPTMMPSQTTSSPCSSSPNSLTRPISPPIKPRTQSSLMQPSISLDATPVSMASRTSETKILRSPFQLTRIRDLDPGDNTDSVSIRDLICDPLIGEIWCFDYLFDPEWIISNLDPDTRPSTKLILIHGSWQLESDNRIRIHEACSKYSNVSQVTAYLPDQFGTHHSKMIILFRHDETAEVIIHTANMIEQDWRNMTQGVWKTGAMFKGGERGIAEAKLGSGLRLKHELMAYLRVYTDRSGQLKLSKLLEQLEEYDFGGVKGALVASVPSRLNATLTGQDTQLWGWPSLKRVLRAVPVQSRATEANGGSGEPEIVIQVSSVASLGSTPNWLKDTFFETLAKSSHPEPHSSLSPLREQGRNNREELNAPAPKFSIVYPTPNTIRNSLDGYASGGSIHMRLDSSTAQKQLVYLHKYLYDWSKLPAPAASGMCNAGRSLAAPHIKTYVRFCGNQSPKSDSPSFIDWALLTSANLSTQAWGSAGKGGNDVRVQSYELGVLVWPALYHDGVNEQDAKMVAVFKKDAPDQFGTQAAKDCTIVGLRMPYSLPLQKYASQQLPWCPSKKEGYAEPDRFGQTWGR